MQPAANQSSAPASQSDVQPKRFRWLSKILTSPSSNSLSWPLLRGLSWPHCETPASIWSSSRGSSLTWQQTDFLFRVDLTPNSVSVCVRPELDFNANSADARPAAQLVRLVAVDLCHVITCGQKFCKETEFNFYFLVVLTRLSLSHHRQLKVDLVPHLPSAPLQLNTDQQSRAEYLLKTLGSHKIMNCFSLNYTISFIKSVEIIHIYNIFLLACVTEF